MCHWVVPSHNTERTLMHHANAVTSLHNGFASGYTLKEPDHAEGHKQKKNTQKENQLQSKYAIIFFYQCKDGSHIWYQNLNALSNPNTCISN